MRAEVTFGIRPDSEFLVAALHWTCERYGAHDVSARLCNDGPIFTLSTGMDIHVSGETTGPREPLFTGLALVHFGFSRRRPGAAGRSRSVVYVFERKI
jgi:hypothetical protein